MSTAPVLKANTSNHAAPDPGESLVTKIRHVFFVVIGVASLFIVWPFAFEWMNSGGNIMNPFSFFTDVFKLGGAPAFLTTDIAVSWITFMVWVVFDSKKIGLGAKWGWAFVGLSYLGTCFAFPVYLVVRDRFLAKQVNQRI